MGERSERKARATKLTPVIIRYDSDDDDDGELVADLKCDVGTYRIYSTPVWILY